MSELQNRLAEMLRECGAADVGFSRVEDGPCGLNFAVTIVARLSDAVVDEINGAPTYTYFHHYRTVNRFLDDLALRCGNLLAENGYKFYPIAASQSAPAHLGQSFQGRYSHKKPAVLSGLGSIGKNCLFLHRRFGARVRLATVFTDFPFTCGTPLEGSLCISCDKCVAACPAGAISGAEWAPGGDNSAFFSPALCSEHMKKAYQNIGRGAVCGLCMRACPAHAAAK